MGAKALGGEEGIATRRLLLQKLGVEKCRSKLRLAIPWEEKRIHWY